MTAAREVIVTGWRSDAPPLYDYQDEGRRWLRSRMSGLLADEMGLGKTVQALAAFCDFKNTRPDARLLVVAPNRLLSTWEEEALKWTTYSVAVATGSAVKRLDAINAKADITVIAYDNLKRNLPDLNDTGFAMVVFDEAHYLKDQRSQRTKAAFGLRCLRRVLMTGSPLLNRVDELWPLLFLIDPPSFSNYWTFVNRYAVFGGWQDKQIIGVQNAAELRSKIAPLMLRRLKADVLEALPPKTVVRRECELLPSQRKMYDQARNELRVEFADHEEEISNALTKLLRLKQITGTPACFGAPDESAKLDLLMDVLDEIGDDNKVVVFTHFRGVATAIENRLVAAKIPYARFTGAESDVERTTARRAFQTLSIAAGGPRVLLCSYGVATEGITLTAASHAVMVDKLYVPALQSQAEDRLHRVGQKDNVTIIELFAKNTIDTRIEKILATKRGVFESIITEDAFEASLRADLDVMELLA
jgi:SNF2 family DNA or RNA helicase